MIIDTSALIAIFFKEPQREIFLDRIYVASKTAIPACVILETSMVLKYRKGKKLLRDFDKLIKSAQPEITPITSQIAHIAVDAFLKYGKGQGHPAQLNFGDCMVYAAAKAEGAPLLYVGDDFAHTDIESAVG